MQATWRGVDAGFQTDRGCPAGKHIALQTDPEPRKRTKAALTQTPVAAAAESSVQTASCSVKEASMQTARPKGTLKEKKTQTDTSAVRVAEVQTDGDFAARLQDVEATQARIRDLEEGRDAALSSTAAAEEELKRVWARCTRSEEALAEMKRSRDMAEKKLRAKNDALDASNESIASARAAAAADADARCAAAERDRDSLRGLADALKSELAKERKETAALEQRVRELGREAPPAASPGEEMVAQLETLHREVGDLTRAKLDLLRKLNDMEEKYRRSEADQEKWREQARLAERETDRAVAELLKVREQAQLSEWKLRRSQELEQRPPGLRSRFRVSARSLLAPLRERQPRQSRGSNRDDSTEEDTTDVGGGTDAGEGSNGDRDADTPLTRRDSVDDDHDVETASTCTSPKLDEEDIGAFMNNNALLEELERAMPKRRKSKQQRSRSNSPWAPSLRSPHGQPVLAA
jgi:hypothetical protein